MEGKRRVSKFINRKGLIDLLPLFHCLLLHRFHGGREIDTRVGRQVFYHEEGVPDGLSVVDGLDVVQEAVGEAHVIVVVPVEIFLNYNLNHSHFFSNPHQ